MQSVARTVAAGLKSSALKRIARTTSPWKTNLPRLFWGDMDNQSLLFEKKKSTLDGALQYAKAALETYTKAKVTIEPIEIGFWKFLVTVDRGEESLNISVKENL